MYLTDLIKPLTRYDICLFALHIRRTCFTHCIQTSLFIVINPFHRTVMDKYQLSLVKGAVAVPIGVRRRDE
jgi:hypothetical protein